MKHAFFAALCALIGFSHSAIAGNWEVQKDSTLTFAYDFMGQETEGRFKTWQADIVFDPDHLEAADISVSVDLTSVDSGGADRDGMLMEKEWFDTSRANHAVFTAQNVSKVSENQYKADGVLMLKGHKIPMVLDFTLLIEGDQATADIEGKLSRSTSELGLESYPDEDTVGETVKIFAHIEALKS